MDKAAEVEREQFRLLFCSELQGLNIPDDDAIVEGRPKPCVTHTQRQLCGLSLAGEGIQAATFGLGFLEALSGRGLLQRVDYLSTAAGGGYIGGVWTAWRSRRSRLMATDAPGSDTPKASGDSESGGRRTLTEDVPREHRATDGPFRDHPRDDTGLRDRLRRFRSFLAPRRSFSETDTGEFAIALLAAVLSGIGVALSLLTLGFWLLSVGSRVLTEASLPVATAAIGLITSLALIPTELFWRRSGKAASESMAGGVAIVATLGALAVSMLSFVEWRRTPAHAALDLTWRQWCDPLMWLTPTGALAAWGSTLALLLGARMLLSASIRTHLHRTRLAALDRVAARLFGLLVVGCVFAGVSAGARWIVEHPALLSAAGAGGAMAAAAKALSVFRPGVPKGYGPTIWAFLNRATTYAVMAALGLSIPLVIAVMEPRERLILVGGAAVMLLLSLWFDPNEVSLHPFFRSRIARAYLGAVADLDLAASDAAVMQSVTTETPTDDLPLSSVEAGRPLHLIVASVDSRGRGAFARMNRNAQSCVLSRHGLSMGGYHLPWAPVVSDTKETKPSRKETVSLAAALALSGSGSGSMLGRRPEEADWSASFLQSAFNLRLGLWLTRQRARDAWQRILPLGLATVEDWAPSAAAGPPGWLFLKELLGRTEASPDDTTIHVHDAAHFESLGLYELVRRHCRYMIVVDCSKDPDRTCAALGRAIRLVRADFGVEIEIDTRPLTRQGDAGKPQRAVVGDVRYGDGDYGILVYVKPVLTGNEPPDVVEYGQHHPTFPHEAIWDQALREDRWEAYRRLGAHTGHSIFSFIDLAPELQAPDARTALIFGRARRRWMAASADLSRTFLELTDRFHEIESTLWLHGSRSLVQAVYPEAWHDRLDGGEKQEAPPRDVLLLGRAMQLMEDVWVGANLEMDWSHPMNLGWMNYFERWCATPMFRSWWPLLRASFGPDFAEFLTRRFRLPEGFCRVTVGTSAINEIEMWGLQARFDWAVRPTETTYLCSLNEGVHTTTRARLPVGIAGVNLEEHAPGAPRAWWWSDRLVIAPGLEGAGLRTRFIRALIDHLTAPDGPTRATQVEVALASTERPPTVPGLPSAWQDRPQRRRRRDAAQLYAEAGFEPSTKRRQRNGEEWPVMVFRR